jgi:hypothetical protein
VSLVPNVVQRNESEDSAFAGSNRSTHRVLTVISPLIAAFFAVVVLLIGTAAWGQQEARPTHITLNATTVEGTRTHATFTAQVTKADNGESTVPTGSVSFMDGERSIGAAVIDSEGKATYTADELAPGERNITAIYQGDANFAISTSAQTVVASAATGVPSYTLSSSVSSLKVVAGQTATTVITATPANGFNQAVSLSCSGVPYTSTTCVFSPAQVTPGAVKASAPNGTPAISTLSIQTTAYGGGGSAGSSELREHSTPKEIAYGLALPGALGLVGLGLVRKKNLFGKASDPVRMVALLCLLLAGSMGMSSCAQRYHYYHKPPTGNPGTPPGTYTVVITGITGTGSSLTTATTTVTLTVTAT